MNKAENAELAEARRIKREAAKEAHREITSRAITTITTALALVAALFWQTAINDTIKTFIPVSGAWSYELAVALLVTAVAATVAYLLTRPVKTEKTGTG